MLNVDEVVRLPYEPPGSALVRQYQSMVERVVQLTGVANVYTCMPVRAGECVIGVINAGSGLTTGTVYNYAQTDAADVWAAALSGQMGTSEVYQDQYGEWLTGVVPLRDSTGRVVGLAGVDIDASHLRVRLDEQIRT